jgi:hypothetical protein
MSPIKTLKRCSAKNYKTRKCGNFQALMFLAKGKKERLFFRTVAGREAYYKSMLKGKKQFSGFKRYSVCSSTAFTRKQQKC